jgi:NAD+ synthase (glutamine-hydrolysing)
MKDGFIKVAAGNMATTLADTKANAAQAVKRIREADEAGANVLVLPELCLTGYTCGDLFCSDTLLRGALEALEEVCEAASGRYPLVILGLPVRHGGKLYNCAAAVCGGELLALIPKTYLPNYGEFYEKRQFSSGAEPGEGEFMFRGRPVPFGQNILLCHESMENYRVGVELCEDLWAPCPPCETLSRCGAELIANCSASNETIGKAEYRRMLLSSTSARLLCGYVYASAGQGESTQDMVFSGHGIIAENGAVLAENPPFGEKTLLCSEIDLARLAGERRRQTSFTTLPEGVCRRVMFRQEIRQTKLTRYVAKNPFVPESGGELSARAESILRIQAAGLKKRMEHTGARTAVIGVSGGLDSCLALLAAARCFDLMGRPRGELTAVTMPGFGTTDRTRDNAGRLCECLGASLREIPIGESALRHFQDIGHDPQKRDVTYENAQARIRTLVLMDIANQEDGIVVGTGDLSELALGWATYNGDHMSMYAVNASVPKTLVRYIVRHEARRCGGELETVLEDILATPVSPELLPAADDGAIRQKTEELVGPYELHDFFLYYFLRFGFSPAKIYRLARYAFGGDYSGETVLKWLRVFVRRFFAQQFKRSCLPDGPKVGSAALSPRGDWRMPSDAVCRLWLEELDGVIPDGEK